MRVVFFNKPVGTPKLCFTVSDLEVSQLRAGGVIPPDAAYLIKNYDPNSPPERMAMLTHVDKLEFDDYTNPTDVVFDMDLVKLWWAEVFRSVREPLLEQLDRLQMQMFARGDRATMDRIEADKQILRDVTDLPNATGVNCFVDAAMIEPNCLFVDYKEKYRSVVSA